MFPRGQLSFVEKWPLMNQNEIMFIIFTYLVFVFVIGPHYMAKRNPFQIKPFLIAYNGFKVFNSMYLGFMFFAYIKDKGLFPKNCEHDETTEYTIAILYWKYMVTKLIDLIDTVLFVLRKKFSQRTFLHVYHHTFMVLVTWVSLKYDPSDHWAFMACMNCGIHAIMYIYYGLSTLGPQFAKYLWWKKYVTILQLIQFVLVMAHILLQSYTSECPITNITLSIVSSNIILFILLFSDFYKKAYLSKEPIIFACHNHID